MAMMHGEGLMSDDDWHVYTGTTLLLLLLLRMMMTVMRMSLLAKRFLQLLVLAAYRDAIDVHRYRHDEPRRFPVVARRRSPATASAGKIAPADPARQQRAAAAAALHHPGLDALPLGSPVLKPDLDLDLAETQLTRDHRALGQRQVLLAVKLLLQLEQLIAGERRTSSPMSPAAAAETRGRSGRRQGRHRLGLRRVIGRDVYVDNAVVGRGPTLDVRLVVGWHRDLVDLAGVAACTRAVACPAAVNVAATFAVDDDILDGRRAPGL